MKVKYLYQSNKSILFFFLTIQGDNSEPSAAEGQTSGFRKLYLLVSLADASNKHKNTKTQRQIQKILACELKHKDKKYKLKQLLDIRTKREPDLKIQEFTLAGEFPKNTNTQRQNIHIKNICW